jgi:hypothetical protein
LDHTHAGFNPPAVFPDDVHKEEVEEVEVEGPTRWKRK